jgi:Flp pilus assembly pilin Flp
MLSYANCLFQAITSFRTDERGAITVDFVVLTSAITLLGVAIVGTFSGETVRIANDTSNFVANQKITP